MGDKKSKKDKAKGQRQAKVKEDRIETVKRDRLQPRIPGVA